MSHPVCYTKRMKIENEILKPIFDLDGTLITEDRESTRLFDFHNAEAILNLEESDLTPLGKLVRDSGKQFDSQSESEQLHHQLVRASYHRH